MRSRTLHRPIAALALVAILALAGARPAAAVNMHLAHRLNTLWSAAISEGPAGLWNRLARWLGGEEKSVVAVPEEPVRPDNNWGMDPSGGH